MLEAEKSEWIVDSGSILIEGSSAPVTTLLVQADRSFTTMLTHPGILSGFGWNHANTVVSEALGNGGVLYMSGFLKTNLKTQLRGNLQRLHSSMLICLDHGRLNPDIENPNSVKTLYSVFQDGLIDVYICTYNEMLNFWHMATGKSRSHSADHISETLEEIAATDTVNKIADNGHGWLMDTPVAP